MRVLFLNEGALGPTMLGHGALEAARRAALGDRPGLEARFASLPPLVGRAERLASEFRGLRRFDLDLQPSRWHAVQGLAARRVVRASLEREGVDVLHVHSHVLAMGLLDIMRRVPTVVSVDTTVWDWRALGIWRRVRRGSKVAMWPSLALERQVFARAATVLAWSKWAQRGVLARCPEARTVIHPPGVDLERFRLAERREPRERLRVLFVGGRFAAKGGDDLLAALGPRLGRDVELDVVTPGALPERPGLRHHVLGPTDEALVELHRQADVLCLPTYGDTSPFVVLEALACGVPVVASTVGAIPELLDHGRAGELVAPGDQAALRAKLDRLLDDGTRRRELGVAGRAHVEAHYDARRQNEALLEILERAAQRTGARPG